MNAYRSALRISAIFMVISVLYIVFSDRFTGMIIGEDAVAYSHVQTIKGLIYVLLTSVIIFLLINKEAGRRKAHIRQLEKQQSDLKQISELSEIDRNELKKRNTFIETIMDNLPIGLAVNKINEGAATYMNKKFQEIYGWTDKDIRDIEEFFEKVYPDKEYRENIKARVMEDIQSGDTGKMKWSGNEITTKSGEKRIIEAQNIPLYDQNLMISTVQDITEKTTTEKLNSEYQESLKKLTLELLVTEEKQRKDIATNIHDNLNQTLVIAKMHITQLIKNTRDEATLERLESAREYIEEAINNSRRITYDLSPPVLYQLGLTEAVRWLAEKIGNEHPLEVNLTVLQKSPEMPESHLILTYRVIQELLTNVVKHSRATKANVTFSIKGDLLLIRITDNGTGFNPELELNPEGSGGGFGLFAVRERLNNLNGSMEIDSQEGKGTSVELKIPLHP